jgi:hypothetical protein
MNWAYRSKGQYGDKVNEWVPEVESSNDTPHSSGRIIRLKREVECELCKVCKKVIGLSDHRYNDTDEIVLIVCEDCLKKGLEVIK